MTSDTYESNQPTRSNLRYVDVGFNGTDPVFHGIYHGKRAHDDDFEHVLQRSRSVGCQKLMITGSSLADSKKAVQVAKSYPGICYATVGVHPCSSKTFLTHSEGTDDVLSSLRELALAGSADGSVVAFGEIGLDYDRLFLSPQDVQLKYFEQQLDLAVELQLPLFLHSRAAAEDFERLLSPRLKELPKGGLVHSFTGTQQELARLLALGLDIGVNGCSLKTEENLEVVKMVPLERLQIETDGPWCEIRPSHASSKYIIGDEEAPILPKAVKKERFVPGLMIKGRNEPCTIPLVAHVIARLKEISVDQVCEASWANTRRMFGMEMRS